MPFACFERYPGLNCGIGGCRPESAAECADFYGCQFPAMITDWRAKFNVGTTAIAGRPRPFLFVELAPYTEGVGEPGDRSTALVRAAQLAALELPLVGMAAAYDYGDIKSRSLFMLSFRDVNCFGAGCACL